VLEERAVARLGDNRCVRSTCAVLASTNATCSRGQGREFRQDLYFRLRVVTIELPSAAATAARDIKRLVDHYLRHFAKLHSKDVESIDREALVALVQYDWPGNVRELKNSIESMGRARARATSSPAAISARDPRAAAGRPGQLAVPRRPQRRRGGDRTTSRVARAVRRQPPEGGEVDGAQRADADRKLKQYGLE